MTRVYPPGQPGTQTNTPPSGTGKRASVSRWQRWSFYLLALALALAGLWLRLQAAPAFDHRPLLILLAFPVILAALIGGLGPGLLATGVVCVGAAWFMPPAGGLWIDRPDDLFQWAFLGINGVLVSVLAGRLRRSLRLAEAARHAQAERLDALNLLAAVAEGSSDAIYAKERDGRYLLFNRAAVEISGKPAEAVLGRDDSVLFPAAAARILEQDRQILMEDRIVTYEDQVDTADGVRDFLNTKGPLHDERGEVIGLFGISRDITATKQTERALLESQDKLMLAMRAARMGSWACEVNTGRFEADAAGMALHGFAPGETITRIEEANRHIHPDDLAEIQRRFEHAIRTQGIYENEYRVVLPDGGVRWIHSLGRVAEGNTHLIGMAQDITARKRLEQEAHERMAQMEALLKQQVAAQTAAAIAHEINQPLVALSAYSEVALRDLERGAPNPERLRHAIEGAVVQAQRAGQKLHELMNMLHGGDVETQPVDLYRLIRESVSDFRAHDENACHLSLDLAPHLPPVRANGAQAQKVLANLLRNGVEAMRAAGMKPEDLRITVRAAAEGGMAEVTVQDSGPGLSADAARRIFEPFFSTKAHGLGLGLAISRALIQAQGGQLWLDPNCSPGARFHFTLPFTHD